MITSHCRWDCEGGGGGCAQFYRRSSFQTRHHQGLDPGQESQVQHGDPFVL